jgi:hypothetical protein
MQKSVPRVHSTTNSIYFPGIFHTRETSLKEVFNDIHLPAAAALAENAMLWTEDKPLTKAASKVKLAFDE